MKKLPLSVLMSLGLASAVACGPCLSIAAPEPTDEPDDTDDTDDDTADAQGAVDRVLEQGVLPADVADRLRRRHG